MQSTKRVTDMDLPMPKRRALQPMNSLVTPPTTPDKKSVIDISNNIKGNGRKLNLHLPSIYSSAKALFQRGAKNIDSSSLVGREKEAAVFSSFLEDSIKGRKCSSIYISGPPGTGKTAQTNLSLDYLSSGDSSSIQHMLGAKVRVLRINCMTVSKPEHIFHELYSAITETAPTRKASFDDLYKVLSGKTNIDSLVVVLDEMDCLITKDQQVLFQLFHCGSHLKSDVLQTKLVLIGISNALDLTDKFLPRLRSNGFNPQSLQFLPYSAEQIKQVILSKLNSLNEQDKENSPNIVPLIHPGAVQLCCKKCATVTGDLRKAFDICYKSIELVEQQAKQKDNFSELTLETAPKVLISHVAKVCASSFGESSEKKIENLNLLQKAVLCCLFNSEKNSNKLISLTVNELYEYYCKHTHKVLDNLLGKIKKGEFLEIVSALESASAVVLSSSSKAYGSVDAGNKQIRPNVSYGDMLNCSEEVGILKRILLATP